MSTTHEDGVRLHGDRSPAASTRATRDGRR